MCPQGGKPITVVLSVDGDIVRVTGALGGYARFSVRFLKFCIPARGGESGIHNGRILLKSPPSFPVFLPYQRSNFVSFGSMSSLCRSIYADSIGMLALLRRAVFVDAICPLSAIPPTCSKIKHLPSGGAAHVHLIYLFLVFV